MATSKVIKEYLIKIGLAEGSAEKLKLETKEALSGLEQQAKQLGTTPAILARTQLGMQALGKSMDGVGKVSVDNVRTFQRGDETYQRYTMAVTSADKKVQTLGVTFQGTTNQGEALNTSLATSSTHTKSLAQNITELTKRAVLVIPVWYLLRTAINSVLNTFREGVQKITEFSDALARAKVVTSGVGNIGDFMEDLAKKAQTLSLAYGKSVKEILEAYYQFGTAGIKGQEAINGMNIALKTSIAMMVDSKETAKMMAGTYNLFKDSLIGVGDTEDQMNMIGSTMAVLWKTNQFELNEFIDGLRTFLATAKNVNLSFDQMTTLLSVSHTLMQKGGTAGTQLTRVFIEMLNKWKDVKRFLTEGGETGMFEKGNLFDIFLKTLDMLVKKAKAGEVGLKQATAEAFQLFGIRGEKIVLSFVSALDLLKKQYGDISIIPLPERMNLLNQLLQEQIDTVTTQRNRLTELKKTIGETFIKGITGVDDFGAALKKINTHLEASIDNVKSFAKALKFTIPPTLIFLLGLLAKAHPVTAAVSTGVAGATWLTAKAQKKQEQYLKDFQLRVVGGQTWQDMFGMSLEDFNKLSEPFRNSYTSASGILLKSLVEPYEEALKLKEKLEGKISEDVATKELIKQKADALKEQEKNNLLIEEQSLELEDQLQLLEKRKIFGATQLQIEKDVLATMKEWSKTAVDPDRLKKIEEQSRKVRKMIQDDVIAISATMEKSFSDAFENILSGEKGISSLGTAFRDTLVSSFRTELSGNLSRLVMASGIGGIWGTALTKFSGGFDDIQTKIQNSHILGITAGMDIALTKWQAGLSGATPNVTSTAGGISTIAGGGARGLPGFGKGGWMTQPYGTPDYTYSVAPNAQGKMVGTRVATNPTRGQVAGGYAQTALIGYSAYQSATAGGASTAGAGMQALGSALLTTAMINAWNPVGWIIGAALLIGGMFMGGKSSQTSMQSQTVENQIAPKIDVTNKQLHIVNRNLIALRSDIKTYILPRSSYWATKTNLEDDFSLAARMGLI